MLIENRDKTPADIQVDVGSKTLPRTNGCALTSNRMTITSNPLADADNKVRYIFFYYSVTFVKYLIIITD